jgi:hypothetical protein
MLALHAGKPWVPGFLSVVIAPMKPGLEEYLGPEIYTVHGAGTLYYPSAQWWISHARRSHPPYGGGCDLQAHIEFLSLDERDPEFAYANVLWSGEIILLGNEDFQEECRFWAAQIKAA